MPYEPLLTEMRYRIPNIMIIWKLDAKLTHNLVHQNLTYSKKHVNHVDCTNL